MITRQTVLIHGAGASINYGFPSGLQLKAEICKAIKIRNEIYRDLIQFKDNEDHVEDFYNNLLLSSEMSIDAFLEHNPQYFEVGRRAIANVLIRKEKHAELFDKWIDKWLDPENKDKHWYQLLFSKLNAPFEEFDKNNLKIITFNYDRSLEYFLLKSMKAKYSEKTEEEVLAKLHTIPILHIYGKLGNLPIYDSENPTVLYDIFGTNRVPTEEQWYNYVSQASQNIITIHQSKEMGDVLTKAQEYLRRAERIYFLGFGYDETNMQRLFVLNGINLLGQEKLGGKCFGTAMGISPHQKRFLMRFGLSRMQLDWDNELKGNRNKPLNFPNCTIYDFLYYNPYSSLE